MIRDEATQNQVDAAHPQRNTWLSANAGSGKTRVLTDRVARLLLNGTDPQNILCLTYTKAAASEMQNRLFSRLGSWAMQDDASLSFELGQLGEQRTLDPEFLAHARTLFARAVETPGGLKIQTIHAFCAGILRRFPLEAEVSPNFREMEDQSAAILRNEVLDELVEGPHADVVHALLSHYTGPDLGTLTASIDKIRDQFGCLDQSRLTQVLGAPSDISQKDFVDSIFECECVSTIRALIDLCEGGSPSDLTAAKKLRTINLDSPTTSDLRILEGLFLYGPKTAVPFGSKAGKFPTIKTRSLDADLMASLDQLMDRIAETREPRMVLVALERSIALNRFAAVFIPAIEKRKLQMSLLDYDDLVRKARALLSDRAVAQWVLFRLDGGIDHVLVDEAQDTSPDQWAVIKQLTQEFAAGEGARPDTQRTIFVVGDKKQSIYSFQGADPAEFDRVQSHFSQQLDEAGSRLHPRELQHSFRSSQAILRVVDSVFVGSESSGLGGEMMHTAFKTQMPGRVDLWPNIDKENKDDFDGKWYDPVDRVSKTHHDVQMANRIAAQIKHMIRHETLPVENESTDTYSKRPITEGDFLILVRRRSTLFSEIIRACKEAELRVAGADRLRVGAELAVKDIAATLRFLALPEDDLSLACALRSPIFGWSEQQLFTLAHRRPEKSYLWMALRNSEEHGDTLAILRDLLKNADFLRPYDLIERILTRHDGRRKLLARLGFEAEDGIDALLSQALTYESGGAPSLTGFLSWMDEDELEVKRQMDTQNDQIRVMTVHGAKGLESPIVILPDAAAQRSNDVRAELLKIDDQIIWKPNADQCPASVVAAKDRIVAAQKRESLRLLYVAMTRAEKWLIVGSAGDVGEGDASWFNTVASGMSRADIVKAVTGDLTHERVGHLEWDELPWADRPKPETKATAPIEFAALPPRDATAPLSPSELGGAKILPEETGDEDRDVALSRGRLVHLLLEHLPDVDLGERLSYGARLIDAHVATVSDGEALLDQVLEMLEHGDLEQVFARETLAEVSITANIPALGNARISGIIDRLIVGQDTVLAVDFKTNRLIPDLPEDTPEGLLRQMGAYQQALAQIYPDKQVETAILWTQDSRLMRLPNDLVADALLRVSLT